jgi:N6-adenosine-specific RNA methylase IME4
MTQLVRYEAARAALAEARTVDEVKDIHDKAEAMRAYGRMAKDTQLEMDAAELRLRAERRLGVLLSTMPKHRGGRPAEKTRSESEQVSELIKLEDIGIDRKLSSRSQKVGGIAERAFEAVVANVRQRIAEQSGRVSLDITSVDKKTRRHNRERVLGECLNALPDKKYGVIVADPEWRFEPWSRETGMDRAADNHYPTSCTEVIAARDVPSIAANDCALFLWATIPMLPHALLVMAAWGFDYRSHYCWGKDKQGTGYWNFEQHELLLIGARGKIPCPSPGTQKPSLQIAPRLKHSQKPDLFLAMIEGWYPTLPKIELNRRGAPRQGWDAWGNETETENRKVETEIEEVETASDVIELPGIFGAWRTALA